MDDLSRLIWCAMVRLVRSWAALPAEILLLRHQLNALRRQSPKRVTVGSIDRQLFVALCRFSPKVRDALKSFKPETILRPHRAGLRAYWGWKSRSCGGRPKTHVDVRQFIRDLSVANPLWGAPRIADSTRRPESRPRAELAARADSPPVRPSLSLRRGHPPAQATAEKVSPAPRFNARRAP